MARNINNLIPAGPYCYTHTSKGYMQCPFMTTKVVNGVTLPFCAHLNMGSIPNGTSDSDYELLKEHYGVDKYGHLNEHPDTDLFLLWDSCKECGVNPEEPGYDWYKGRVPKTYPHQVLVFVVTEYKAPYTVSVAIPKNAPLGVRVSALSSKLRKIGKSIPATKLTPKNRPEAVISFEGVRNSSLHTVAFRFAETLSLSDITNSGKLTRFCASLLRSL